MTFDTTQARELENQMLGESNSDVAEAFRTITALVIE